MASRAPSDRVGSLGRILVVDDEFHVGALLRDALTTLGYIVEHADGGAEALDLLPTFRPHVTLVDLKMPGMSGMEVLDRLRRVRPGMPVILVSGNQDAELVRQAIGRGAFDYLKKPFDIALLERVVGAAIRGAQIRHDCGCLVCARALQLIRSIVRPGNEEPEAFLTRLDIEATAIIRAAGEDGP
jgi:DNA-binding response OmpR family regulator